MKKVNIKNITIDDGENRIDFEMNLFNVEKYDKANFRTITTSTIAQIEITNTKSREVNIENIGLAVLSDQETDIIYSPKSFPSGLILKKGDCATFSFYAYEIKLIFGKSKNEKGVFVINYGQKDNQYSSSYINGDTIERLIADLESEDIGYNWSASDITRLNSMCTFDKATQVLKKDNSLISEMDIDKPGDALKISLTIFNDRIITAEQKEVKSKSSISFIY
jgi:hypothetical protein